MSLIALAILTTNLAKQPKQWVPMLRFTGKAGVYKDFDTYRQELKKLPSLIPNEPRIFSDGSMILTDGSIALAIFDPTYLPVQIVVAKWQIIELILKDGPTATFRYKDLPAPLSDLIYDKLAMLKEPYDDDLRVHFLCQMSTRIDTEDNKARFNISQQPIATPETEKQQTEKELKDHRLKKATRYDSPKGPKLQYEPDVKVFVEDRANYGSHAAAERKSLEIFSHWLIKEHLNLDNKLINHLELKQLLNPLATILRSKTLGDYSQISSKGFAEAMEYLQKKGTNAGYGDSDSLRSALSLASLSTQGGFILQVSDSGEKIIDFPLIRGLADK